MTASNSVATKAADNRRGHGLLSRLFAHPALQLIGGLITAVWLPAAVHVLLSDLEWTNRWLQHTAVVSCAAIIVGYVIYYRTAIISNAEAIKSVLASLTSTFGIALVLLAVLRIEHDGYLLATSYLLSIGWFFGLLQAVGHVRSLQFLLVPGKGTPCLMNIPGTNWQMLKSPDSQGIPCDGVVVDSWIGPSDQWTQFIKTTALAGTPIYDSRQVREALTGRVDINQVSESWFASLILGRPYGHAKLIADWVGAFIILALLSPVLLAIALLIRLESPGPAIVRQKRIGHRGKVFTLFKFRTMPTGVSMGEDHHDHITAENGESRPTKVGGVLRRYRLDMLPQMINILRGEMSWIGPSAEPDSIFKVYQDKLPLYRYRLIVRPGFTGWARINQNRLTDYADVCDKLHYDFYYVKNYSPWLDALIVLRIVGIMLGGNGTRTNHNVS